MPVNGVKKRVLISDGKVQLEAGARYEFRVKRIDGVFVMFGNSREAEKLRAEERKRAGRFRFEVSRAPG